MPFSAYAWKLYRESQEGQAALVRDVAKHAALLPGMTSSPFEAPLCVASEDAYTDDSAPMSGQWVRMDMLQAIAECFEGIEISSLEDAEQHFVEMIDEGVAWKSRQVGKEQVVLLGGGKHFKEGYEEIFVRIQAISAGLHMAYPEFFIPYLFEARFDHFQRICDHYSIELPEIPGKLQKRQRALFYLEINRALRKFRYHHGLSPSEFNAFLYDFAAKDVPEPDIGVLPAPSRVWFIMGGINNNGDFETLDACSPASILYWQGSLEMRPGDVVIMWCVSPRSSIHSIWRTLVEGFNDPFFCYYSTIRIGHPVVVPPIPFSILVAHPMLGKNAGVRARFQGRGGMAFSVEEYEAILDLIAERGFDRTLLPPPPPKSELPNLSLTNERDVESRLLEPLLREMGFVDEDWVYQMRVRMGRGERNVPDYVLGVDSTKGEESAVLLIEAKHDVATAKNRKEAFVQGRSYALRMQAVVLAIAARQGLWIFQRRSDGFSEDHYVFKNWRELCHPDVRHEISLIIGKRFVDEEIARRKRSKRH